MPDRGVRSQVVARDAVALQARDALLQPSTPGGSGTAHTTTDSSNRITHWQFSGASSSDNLDEYFTYDSAET